MANNLGHSPETQAYSPGAEALGGAAPAAVEHPIDIDFAGQHWDTLISRIQRGECTPVIGAGACMPLLPSGSELSQALAGRPPEPVYPLPDRDNLSRVAQFVAVQNMDELKPKERIKEILEGRLSGLGRVPATQVHNLLARLKLPIYLTTNYDDLMSRALRQAGITPRTEFCRWSRMLLDQEKSEFDTGWKPSPSEPVVFHLHGALTVPESMVVTEDDYLDFLVNLGKDLASSPASIEHERRAALPLPIRRALTRTTLLFIGYSLSDINFRVILRALVGSLDRANRKLSITLQVPPTKEQYENFAAVREYLKSYFRWTLELEVCWGDASRFGAELARQLTEKGFLR